MISSRQGQLVLIVSSGQPGASSRPFEITVATAQTGTSPARNRAPSAPAAAVTAAIASAHADPAGPGSTGSAASARHQPVNTTRTASIRSVNRRNQPRTVSAGRPSSAAIHRYPEPVALAARADPITAAMSARWASTPTGNNTASPHSWCSQHDEGPAATTRRGPGHRGHGRAPTRPARPNTPGKLAHPTPTTSRLAPRPSLP